MFELVRVVWQRISRHLIPRPLKKNLGTPPASFVELRYDWVKRKRTEDCVRARINRPQNTNRVLMMHDALEEIKAYSKAVFLGEIECSRKCCPYCDSQALFSTWASGP